VGGMVVTYGLTTTMVIAVYLVFLLLPDLKVLSEEARLALGIAFGLVLSLALVRPCYSVWLALDFWIEPWKPEQK
jgi:hypothetical protein